MTTYTFHTLCLVACSILPERKHRRCFEGSRKERIGNVIRSRCKAIQPGTSAGQSFNNAISDILQLSVIVNSQRLYKTHRNTEITLNHHKIKDNPPLVSTYTLNSAKNNVKRMCNHEIAYINREFCRKTTAKRITTRFKMQKTLYRGVCFINLRNIPFLYPCPKV